MSSATRAHGDANKNGSSAVGKVLNLPHFPTLVQNPVPENIFGIDLLDTNKLRASDVTILNDFFDTFAVPAVLRPVLEEVFSYAAREAVTRGTLPPADILKTALATAIANHDTTSGSVARSKCVKHFEFTNNAAAKPERREAEAACSPAKMRVNDYTAAYKLPAGLEWPTEPYATSFEKGKPDSIVRFLRRLWAPLIAAGIPVTRQMLAAFCGDDAAEAVHGYEKGGKRQLPPDVTILRKTELVDQKFEKNPGAIFSDARLAQTFASRVRSGKRIPAPR